MRILIVDDNVSSRLLMEKVVAKLGHDPLGARNADEALDLYDASPFPMVVTDLCMPGMSGIELIQQIHKRPQGKQTDVVLITAHGGMESAIEALRNGAYDYLNKPVNLDEFSIVVERVADHQSLLSENNDLRHRFEGEVQRATKILNMELDAALDAYQSVIGIGQIVADSDEMSDLVEECQLYHDDPEVPVLILGETGTGKEVIARLIHFGKRRPVHQPFVDLNCTAISRELFEAELFGYEPGAFTGARTDGAPGKLELAGAGTLFLDEIGDMPLDLQPKLLRVLQERTYYRVGGARKYEFKARVICATNQDLEASMNAGRFRPDLYHRLCVGSIRVPPLRERREEIPALATLFLQQVAKRKNRKFREISGEALDLLQDQDWPGNVRELENTIERALLTSDGAILTPAHLAFLTITESGLVRMAGPDSSTPVYLSAKALKLPEDSFHLDDHENQIILRALEKFDGNKTRCAEYLGLSRFALQRRLEKIEDPT